MTGATGRVGRLVVDELLRAGTSVRALTRRPEHAALPAGVEVVAGDLTVPASLDPALEGAGAVFLVWTAAPATAPAVVARLAAHTSAQSEQRPMQRRISLTSSSATSAAAHAVHVWTQSPHESIAAARSPASSPVAYGAASIISRA